MDGFLHPVTYYNNENIIINYALQNCETTMDKNGRLVCNTILAYSYCVKLIFKNLELFLIFILVVVLMRCKSAT
jgi:hypothetical protein